MFYLFIAILLFCFSFLHLNTWAVYHKRDYIICFILFVVIAGFAYQTGVDWRIYSSVYDFSEPIDRAILAGTFFEPNSGVITEPGYALLSSIVKFFTDDFQYVMFWANFIAAFFLFKGFYKYKSNLYLSLLLYLGYIYLTLNMSGIRQAVAVAIVFYALSFLHTKQYRNYTFWVLVAGTFHVSALIMLPAAFLLNRKINDKFVYLVLGIGLVIYTLRISLVNQFIISIGESFDNPFIMKAYKYSLTANEGNVFSFKVLLNFVMLIFFLRYKKKMCDRNEYVSIFLNLFIIYLFVLEYLWDTGEIVRRLQFYFLLGLIVILPEFLMSLKIRTNKLICLFYIFLLTIWSSNPIFLDLPNGKPYNPYQNYIIYRIFDRQSTGEQRLNEFAD